MSNVTSVVSGYIPSCSRTSADSFRQADALEYDPTTYHYYKTLWPNVIPGIVLGGLAAVGFLFFLLWLCIQCCRRRRSQRRTKVLLDAGAGIELQFISGRQYNSQYFQPPQGPLRRRLTAGRVFKAAIALLALATVGVAAWGLAASIHETNETVPSFWHVVDAADAKVANATTTLKTLDSQMTQVSDALDVLTTQWTRVSGVLSQLGVSSDDINTLGSVPAAAKSQLDDLQQGVRQGVDLLQSKGNQTIVDLRNDFYETSRDVENKWRFIPIAVVFGVTIILAALVGVLTVWMRWPRWASFSVALMWLAVVLLMFIGVGLMRGVYEVGQDSCLYLEPFALRYANDHIGDPGDRTKVLAALQYYFGERDIPDAQVAQTLVGADTQQVHQILQGSQVRSMLALLDPTGRDLVRTVGQLASIPQDDVNKILGITVLVPRLEQSVTSLEQQLQRPNIEPVYQQAKQWVCCEVTDSAYSVWEAWTVAGCLGWVLAAASSVRVVLHTLGIRRSQKRLEASQPEAGLPPAFPYVGDSPTGSESHYRSDSAAAVVAAPAAPPPAGPAASPAPAAAMPPSRLVPRPGGPPTQPPGLLPGTQAAVGPARGPPGGAAFALA